MTTVSDHIDTADTLTPGSGQVVFDSTGLRYYVAWFKVRTYADGGLAHFDTFGTGDGVRNAAADTLLTLYSGPANASTDYDLTQLAENDDANNTTYNSAINYTLLPNTHYWVKCDNSGGYPATNYTLNWSNVPGPPPPPPVIASRYQQIRWLDLLVAAVDHVQALHGSTPLGSPQTASVVRRGLWVVNAAPVALSEATMDHVGFFQGTTLLFSLPWTGGSAVEGQLALSVGSA